MSFFSALAGEPSITAMSEWVQALVQLATAGGFAALLWYMVIKHIPAIEDRHRSERQEWLVYIRARDSEYDQLVRDSLKAISELREELRLRKQ